VKCEFRISDSCCPVEADEGQMRQVIQNMVINAKEAMPGGGLLQIRAEEVHLREKEVPPLKGGKYAEISVEDHGIGIPKENLSRIFEPYVTTKEMGTQKGLGLGLAICYSIVKNHGGHITVESEIGRGTVFHIYLSIAEGRPGVEEGEKMVPAAGKGRVLIMDDEKAVTDVAEELLSLAGYEIVVTKDGTEAIRVYEKAREQGNPFDVVILDLTIPGGMGGLETMKRLCVIDHSVKGIVSSGYSEDPVLNEYESYGFKGSLVKPYTIETLRETVDRVIGTK
jgi:CheY-like chemotaxis protein